MNLVKDQLKYINEKYDLTKKEKDLLELVNELNLIDFIQDMRYDSPVNMLKIKLTDLIFLIR